MSTIKPQDALPTGNETSLMSGLEGDHDKVSELHSSSPDSQNGDLEIIGELTFSELFDRFS